MISNRALFIFQEMGRKYEELRNLKLFHRFFFFDNFGTLIFFYSQMCSYLLFWVDLKTWI